METEKEARSEKRQSLKEKKGEGEALSGEKEGVLRRRRRESERINLRR